MNWRLVSMSSSQWRTLFIHRLRRLAQIVSHTAAVADKLRRAEKPSLSQTLTLSLSNGSMEAQSMGSVPLLLLLHHSIIPAFDLRRS